MKAERRRRYLNPGRPRIYPLHGVALAATPMVHHLSARVAPRVGRWASSKLMLNYGFQPKAHQEAVVRSAEQLFGKKFIRRVRIAPISPFSGSQGANTRFLRDARVDATQRAIGGIIAGPESVAKKIGRSVSTYWRMYRNARPEIRISETARPETLAHELGHALHGTRLRGAINNAVRTTSTAAASVAGRMVARLGEKIAPMMSGERMTRALSHMPSGANIVNYGSLVGHEAVAASPMSTKAKRRAHIALGIAPFAAIAPKIGEEVGASYTAIKILRNAGYKGSQLRGKVRNLGYALGTHSVGAIPLLATSAVAAGELYALRKQRQFDEKHRRGANR